MAVGFEPWIPEYEWSAIVYASPLRTVRGLDTRHKYYRIFQFTTPTIFQSFSKIKVLKDAIRTRIISKMLILNV